MDANQIDPTLWRENGVPVSSRFDDPYYSLQNGLEETRHVFLAGNDLPERLRDGFHIAELGFGTGLNLIASLALWRDTGQTGRLHFTSFELYPMAPEIAQKALAAFPKAAPFADLVAQALSDPNRPLTRDDLHLEIITGDARQTLPDWSQKADAWFLDGFSPAKNPELWGEDLMAEIGRHTRGGGTFATYTAAGHVRRALVAAGFDVTRVPGYGHKRHMSIGRKTLWSATPASASR